MIVLEAHNTNGIPSWYARVPSGTRRVPSTLALALEASPRRAYGAPGPFVCAPLCVCLARALRPRVVTMAVIHELIPYYGTRITGTRVLIPEVSSSFSFIQSLDSKPSLARLRVPHTKVLGERSSVLSPLVPAGDMSGMWHVQRPPRDLSPDARA